MDYASSILGLLPTGRRSVGVTQLLNKLETYLPPAQVDRVRDAVPADTALLEYVRFDESEPWKHAPEAHYAVVVVMGSEVMGSEVLSRATSDPLTHSVISPRRSATRTASVRFVTCNFPQIDAT